MKILLPVDSRVDNTQGFVVLDTETGNVQNTVTEEALPFTRKGFRGACGVGDRIYVCNSFSIKSYRVRCDDQNIRFSFENQWYRPEWSVGQAANADLHCLFYDKSRQCLLLANSFNDCIDTLSLDGELLERRYLWEISSSIRELLGSKDRRAADLCHFNHIERVGPDLLATLGNLNGTEKGAVLNLDSGEILLNGLSRPHDGSWMGGDYYVVETSSRRILRFPSLQRASDITLVTPQIIDLASYLDRTPSGQIWMRGLLLSGTILYVGCSQFQDRMSGSVGVSPSRVLAVSVPDGEAVGDYPIHGDEVLRNPVIYSILNLDRIA